MGYKEKIRQQYTDVEDALKTLTAQTTHDLWKAIEEWEFLLEQKTLLRRITEQKNSGKAMLSRS